ncbi:sensor histidine kinase RegB [Epibacterium ulvae]|uniref:sensor histidine kinase RegB n=1 Tax=Epibacterium ulvae TaxID=1156985 RepID=UPI0024921881|nr:ActS/PrrB/RegB family redox-sensitive histidine kinase [Epibacterium ulvae]
MNESTPPLMNGQERSNWIRLSTLTLLRWVAIFGQLTALFIGQWLYGLQLPLGLCFLAIGTSIVSNLAATFMFPANKRLTEYQNFLMVMFDLLQLTFLLYLTGGLNNPFALLVLGPVTISASTLGLRSALAIGGSAVALVTLLLPFHLELVLTDGSELVLPEIFMFGNWIAIVIAILFNGAYSYRINSEIRSMSDALSATQMALSREQKLTDLGGVVAAAAHELGTPLATIKLASSELAEELETRPELQEDAILIRDQADRCRDILRDMGRAGKSDLHMQQAPLSAVLDEAAEPHMTRGKTIHIEVAALYSQYSDQPNILRKPEIIHGIRNLIQNGVDFARGNVWVEASWSDESISVKISDDGVGYPSHLLGRIGDPFVRKRRSETDRRQRPEYEGMGLGLFIAKTLLERSGAQLQFANGSDPFQTLLPNTIRRGAIVQVSWPRHKIDAIEGDQALPLGKNKKIVV